jgi:heavy-metal-associated domain-containing protein
MARTVHLAHHLPGRLRVRIPAGARNPPVLDQIKASIASVPGVRRVDVNTAIGSMVVHYDAAQTDDFIETVKRHGLDTKLFELVDPEIGAVAEAVDAIEAETEELAAHSATARTLVQFVSGLNDEVKRATNNALDLKVLVPLTLAGYSLLHHRSKLSTPMWVTLGLFSFTSFVALHHPQEARQPAAGQAEGAIKPSSKRRSASARRR